MDEQASRGEEIISLRSERNLMDPLFRFPENDDLRQLFAHATLTEAMLVALDHMQVNFVRISSSGLRKFRRNTLSFPQDLAGFARRLDLTKNFKPLDRVNSYRGYSDNAENPDRPVRRAVHATEAERAKLAVDEFGAFIFPGTVIERHADGVLLVEYDKEAGGGRVVLCCVVLYGVVLRSVV